MPVTNTQGKPLYRPTMSPSQGTALHVPQDESKRGEVMEKDSIEFAALIGIDWADRKHDGCLMAVAHRSASGSSSSTSQRRFASGLRDCVSGSVELSSPCA